MAIQSASRLRSVLARVLRQDTTITGYDEQEVLEELSLHKQLLLRLLDVGGRDAGERREVESGKIIVDGRSMAFNSDFARQAVFLSDQLDVSERYMAKLLHSVNQQNPNLSSAECVELAVTYFHRRRQELLDCLTYILDAAIASDAPDTPPVYQRVESFAREHLFVPQRTGTQRQSLALTVVQSIHTTTQLLEKTTAAKQNSVSQTNLPSTQGGAASLSHDVLESRCNALRHERRSLSNLIYLIARFGHLSSTELKVVINWLAENPYHDLTYYFLAATLAALDPVPSDNDIGVARGLLSKDRPFVDHMKKKLDPSSTWKEPALKALITLKWTMYLTDARHRDPTLELENGFQADELEALVWNGVQGDAFQYITRLIIQLHRKGTLLPASLLARVPPLEQEQYRKPPAPSFVPSILEELEILVLSLIRFASSELRKVKQRQEDIVSASSRTDRNRPFRSSGPEPQSEAGAPVPRNDIAAFFSCVGVLYSTLPSDRALQFWGAKPLAMPAPRRSSLVHLMAAELATPKLPSFLQWSVWSTQNRDEESTTPLFDLLTGLAKGQQCSELTFNFVSQGSGDPIQISIGNVVGSGAAISWHALFGQLELWASQATNQSAPAAPPQVSTFNASSQWRSQAPPAQPSNQVVLRDPQVAKIEAFLRLLSMVVTHSIEVRLTVVAHTQYRAIPSLVNLVPLGVPLRLKGALFEALASFCEPGAGASGIEICRAIWTLMERQEVINVRGPLTSHLVPVKGVEMELDQIETPHKQYPATIPFLRLLVTLIHTPKRVQLHERILDEQSTQTIPEALGQPYRLPGIGPFVAFVVDQVFSKIPQRDYLQSSDRWEMNDLCLAFIERSLASYDLESLITLAENHETATNALLPFLTHPGFDILKRLLTDTPLQKSVISYIVDGIEGFDKGFATEEPHFHSTIVRILRIVLRVLEIQDIYLDVLIPMLTDSGAETIVGQVPARSAFTTLDRILSFSPEYASALAAYVSFPAYAELVLLSIKVTSHLARSPSFPDFTTVVERSAESERILAGYRHVLSSDAHEDTTAAETRAEQVTGAGAEDVDDALEFPQATRLAVLDMLIFHTSTARQYPNFAHFLLFGQSRATKVEDPHARGAQAACIHTLINLLNAAVPEVTGRRRQEVDAESAPLFLTLPTLAERCCRVIHQLCSHPRTSEFVARYLRTQEDFFARQLAALPYQVPSCEDESPIEVVYVDGSRAITSVPVTSAFLQYRSLILDLIALELHVLSAKGHYQSAADLTTLLLEAQERDDGEHNGLITGFREIGQSHMRIVELAQSLNFDWSDSLRVAPVDLEFLGQLNLGACIRLDDSGCEVVDRAAVLNLISSGRRALYLQGRLTTQTHAEQLRSEIAYILESCAVENHRREVQFAVASGYKSWRRLLDITLTRCFNRLPYDQRENMLFDLLHVVPRIIGSTTIPEPTAVLLAEAQLSTITKLREHRVFQLMAQGDSESALASSLPAERLYALLRDIVQCVSSKSRGELVRGNLYAALVNLLQLASAGADSSSSAALKSDSLALSRLNEDDLLMSLNRSVISASTGTQGTAFTSMVQRGISVALEGYMTHVVTMAGRDALDGVEVWRTVALSLLDSLVNLENGKRVNPAVGTLVRQGVLSNLIGALEHDDVRLQALLKPDPEDLHSLYVYEAKMALLLRIALTRPGAERLLEARLMPSLAKGEFLDSRPDSDQAFTDQDAFLPSAIQRYHQLFVPALQLVDAMLASLGNDHVSAGKQALEFLTSHRDTFIILLKNEADANSLSAVEEVRLVVDIAAHLLPAVPKSDMSSTISGFGGVHAAILNLSARFLGADEGTHGVYPQTEAEYQEAQIFSKGSAQSNFEVKALARTQALRNSLVVYLGAVSEFTEPGLNLVLSPLVARTRREETSTRSLASTPTVGDAIDALDLLTNRISALFNQVIALSAELASEDRLRVDALYELVSVPDSDFLEDLDVQQKQSLVGAQLNRIRGKTRGDASHLMSTVEMMLLLLWRHLQHFAEARYQPDVPSRTSFGQSTRMLAPPDADAFISETRRKLNPVLQRLSGLDINADTMGNEWRFTAEYLDIMCRRLSEEIGSSSVSPSNQSP